MKRSLFHLSLCLAAYSVLFLADGARAARAPLVLAFYYDWFDENIWKPDQVADMPVTPYASRDAGTIARHIQQARGAGIDAFVVSWWGAGNPTDDNFKTLLDQARAANFQAAVDFELTSPFYHSKDDAIRSIRNLLATHVNHPAYLHVDGKPVVFFWREQKYSVDEWRAIRDAVDPNRQSLWIAEGIDTAYLRVFDGHHLYSIAWAKDVAAELQKWPARVRAAGADKIWAATVMPGNDDTRTRRPDAYVRERHGGEFYRETWRAAFSTYPDWIIITSWNEWVEGTMIEPSVSYGNLYLDITREFAAQFKAGLPTPTPTLTRTPKPTATITPSPTSPLSPPLSGEGGITAIVNITDTLRVRAEPSTDAEILGRLRPGALVTVLARSEDAFWWQIAFPDASRRGWIAAEFVTIDGDMEALPVSGPTVMPTPTLEPTFTPEPTQTPTETPSPEPTITAIPTRSPTPTAKPAALNVPLLEDILNWLPWR